jgi:hypothetical protein
MRPIPAALGAIFVAGLFSLPGCAGRFEKAGANVDDALDDAEQQFEDLADSIKDLDVEADD